MKAPVVDYRKLRPNNITSPEYRHLLLLSGWLVYFASFFITENLISPERCRVVHCALDDKIPFCEWFIIFYVGWYFLIVGSLLWFALYDIEGFTSLQTYIIIVQSIATVAYIIFPSRQELRPETFPRENIASALVGLIYKADTPTGICPSLHAAVSFGITSAWLKEKDASKITKTLIVIFAVLICLSILFVKQHSAVDIIAALPMCLFAELISFKRYYKGKIQAHKRSHGVLP